MNQGITRRKFLSKSLAATAGVGLGAALQHRVWSQIRGANADIRVAIAGVNRKGLGHIYDFRKIPGVRVVALCDPDQQILDQRLHDISTTRQDEFGNRLPAITTPMDKFTDIRHLLDRQDIDALVIATPNHWHALMGIWACQAGKDVYVEKPVSHNVWEGGQLVKAARKYNRILQAGTQGRSDAGLRAAAEYIQSGHLGAIKLARGISYRARQSIGRVEGPQAIPNHIDYDLWCGPASKDSLRRKELHYDWNWFWPTGNGDLGNMGVHRMDLCRWFIKKMELPKRVISLGGRFGYIDDGETPNTQIALLVYDTVPILFEVRNLGRSKDDWNLDHYKGVRQGVIIECEHGYFAGGMVGGWAYDHAGKKMKQFLGDGGSQHQANFIQAMRSRKKEDLNADILDGHLSSAMCHVANISYRLGEPADRRKILEKIGSHDVLSECFERFQDHLLVNHINLEQTARLLGPWLEIDSQSERFIGDLADQANPFLTRTYRNPFIVPQDI